MDDTRNPLRNIPNTATRHMIMQILAWMWCIVFTAMTGTWMYFESSYLSIIVLIFGTFITAIIFKKGGEFTKEQALKIRKSENQIISKFIK